MNGGNRVTGLILPPFSRLGRVESRLTFFSSPLPSFDGLASQSGSERGGRALPLVGARLVAWGSFFGSLEPCAGGCVAPCNATMSNAFSFGSL
jgi:hypothetical protein